MHGVGEQGFGEPQHLFEGTERATVTVTGRYGKGR